MKILFLDIDGVMNTNAGLKRWWKAHGNNHCIDVRHVEVLNKIMEDHPDLRIVISSTWRLYFRPWQLSNMLERQGFRFVDRIIGQTRIDQGGEPRGHQIRDWLADHGEAHGVNGFVILDDGCDMEPHRGHLVQTTPKLGLLEKHLPAINRVLALPWPKRFIHMVDGYKTDHSVLYHETPTKP